MVDTVFSSFGRHALSSLRKLVTTTDIFHNFFLDFSSKSICNSALLVLLPLKFQKNDMKLRKIKSKIWKDISSVSNLLLLTASQEIFTFLQQILKLIVCSNQIFDRLCEEKLLQTIELIALNSHIINDIEIILLNI